jgi:hypothetical protein
MRVSVFNSVKDIAKILEGVTFDESAKSAAFLVVDSEFAPVPGEIRVIRDERDALAYIMGRFAGVSVKPENEK